MFFFLINVFCLCEIRDKMMILFDFYERILYEVIAFQTIKITLPANQAVAATRQSLGDYIGQNIVVTMPSATKYTELMW